MRTKTFDKTEASPEAQAIADQLLKRAQKQVGQIDALARARTLGWQHRLESVQAGQPGMAAVYLEALAVLGDRGAIKGVREAAAVTA